jgi:hypothetical protein
MRDAINAMIIRSTGYRKMIACQVTFKVLASAMRSVKAMEPAI